MKSKVNLRWTLVIYDILILLFILVLLLMLHKGAGILSFRMLLEQTVLFLAAIFSCRFLGRVYSQIWRYGGIQCYVRLMVTDSVAFIVTVILEKLLPVEGILFVQQLSIAAMNLLCCLAIRMIYRLAYKTQHERNIRGKCMRILLRVFSGASAQSGGRNEVNRTKAAILGADTVGVSLAEELLNSPASPYILCCFVDNDPVKANRVIHNILVLPENEASVSILKQMEVQEIIFAIPSRSNAQRKKLYDFFTAEGFKVKVYDFPVMQSTGGGRYLREFDMEELLFRKPIIITDDRTKDYYKDKVILITGGGGSIGSEICRQLASMSPRQIIIVDICENGAYDVQQELQIAYGKKLDLQVEIVSITNMKGMMRVFETYHPQILINAAAHKHVPLMERNCAEAVENNVFGTEVLLKLCETFRCNRFLMVSTDKAVNPTNVMGATKRMCEMLVLGTGAKGKILCSVTRFGNVLGSAGSVIPLFKKQIAAGGPVTITDKRIIRYFMTIPEAAQMVLESGAIAKGGELFVLDMGKPVKILDLAENMIRLSGVQDIEIVDTGLRSGEKLYEELSAKTEELDRTENSLICIEHDRPPDEEQLRQKMNVLHAACASGDDEAVRQALKQVVPTYHAPMR